VRKQGKKVYAASLEMCYALKQSANHLMHLKPVWFGDCYIDPPEKTHPGPAHHVAPATTPVPVVLKKPRRAAKPN
jgi:hypothetical protein